MTGMKAIRSRSVVTSLCLCLMQRTDVVGLKLAESRLTLRLPGFRFFLDSRAFCITFSNFNIDLAFLFHWTNGFAISLF